MEKISLRELRKNKEYTMQELADVIGVTPQTIHYWETKKTRPPKTARIAISLMLRVKEDDIDW